VRICVCVYARVYVCMYVCISSKLKYQGTVMAEKERWRERECECLCVSVCVCVCQCVTVCVCAIESGRKAQGMQGVRMCMLSRSRMHSALL